MTPEQFKSEMAALPEPPSTYRPPFWNHWRHDLWERGKSENPFEFDKWPCIYHTMLVNHFGKPVELQYDRVKKAKPRLLAETYLPPFPRDRFKNTCYSMNLIHQAHHLLVYFETIGNSPRRQNNVVEFGGGYGAMALLIRRLRMAVNYHLLDFPEFSLLQEFYLSQTGIKSRIFWNDPPDKCDLLIACHSISEIPIENRDSLLARLRPRRVLFLYNSKFVTYDNKAYFQEHLPQKFPSMRFRHVPGDEWFMPGSWYTIGW